MNRKSSGLASLHSGISAGLKAYAGGGEVKHFSRGGGLSDYSPDSFLDWLADNYGYATPGGVEGITVTGSRDNGISYGGFSSPTDFSGYYTAGSGYDIGSGGGAGGAGDALAGAQNEGGHYEYDLVQVGDDGYGGPIYDRVPRWVPTPPALPTNLANVEPVITPPTPNVPMPTPFADIPASMLGSIRDVTSDVYVPDPGAYTNAMNAAYEEDNTAGLGQGNPYGTSQNPLSGLGGRVLDALGNVIQENLEPFTNAIGVVVPSARTWDERLGAWVSNLGQDTTGSPNPVDEYLSTGWRQDPFAGSGVDDYGQPADYGFTGMTNPQLNEAITGGGYTPTAAEPFAGSFVGSGVDDYGQPADYGFTGMTNAELNEAITGGGYTPTTPATNGIEEIVVTAPSPGTGGFTPTVEVPTTTTTPTTIQDIPTVTVPGSTAPIINEGGGPATSSTYDLTPAYKKNWDTLVMPERGAPRGAPLVQTGTDTSSGMSFQTYAPSALDDYLARLQKLQSGPQTAGIGGIGYQALAGEEAFAAPSVTRRANIINPVTTEPSAPATSGPTVAPETPTQGVDSYTGAIDYSSVVPTTQPVSPTLPSTTESVTLPEISSYVPTLPTVSDNIVDYLAAQEPVYQEPEYQEPAAPTYPTYQEPVYQEPVYQEPVYQEPVYQEPAAPTYPTYQEPVYQEPTYQEPTYQEPVYQEPVYQEPAAPTYPTYQEPTYQEPAYQEPTYQEPVYQEPVAPTYPTYQEPTYQEPAYQEPTYQEPVYEEPVAAMYRMYQEPVYQEPTATEVQIEANRQAQQTNDELIAALTDQINAAEAQVTTGEQRAQEERDALARSTQDFEKQQADWTQGLQDKAATSQANTEQWLADYQTKMEAARAGVAEPSPEVQATYDRGQQMQQEAEARQAAFEKSGLEALVPGYDQRQAEIERQMAEGRAQSQEKTAANLEQIDATQQLLRDIAEGRNLPPASPEVQATYDRGQQMQQEAEARQAAFEKSGLEALVPGYDQRQAEIERQMAEGRAQSQEKTAANLEQIDATQQLLRDIAEGRNLPPASPEVQATYDRGQQMQQEAADRLAAFEKSGLEALVPGYTAQKEAFSKQIQDSIEALHAQTAQRREDYQNQLAEARERGAATAITPERQAVSDAIKATYERGQQMQQEREALQAKISDPEFQRASMEALVPGYTAQQEAFSKQIQDSIEALHAQTAQRREDYQNQLAEARERGAATAITPERQAVSDAIKATYERVQAQQTQQTALQQQLEAKQQAREQAMAEANAAAQAKADARRADYQNQLAEARERGAATAITPERQAVSDAIKATYDRIQQMQQTQQTQQTALQQQLEAKQQAREQAMAEANAAAQAKADARRADYQNQLAEARERGAATAITPERQAVSDAIKATYERVQAQQTALQKQLEAKQQAREQAMAEANAAAQAKAEERDRLAAARRADYQNQLAEARERGAATAITPERQAVSDAIKATSDAIKATYDRGQQIHQEIQARQAQQAQQTQQTPLQQQLEAKQKARAESQAKAAAEKQAQIAAAQAQAKAEEEKRAKAEAEAAARAKAEAAANAKAKAEAQAKLQANPKAVAEALAKAKAEAAAKQARYEEFLKKYTPPNATVEQKAEAEQRARSAAAAAPTTTKLAGGGIASLPEYRAGGKLLRGPGDGMSDSIPAMIHGNKPQRAALADGEFVIPADVVSHLGNGSTEAGARHLYAMMDRIRQARTGRKQQAPAVQASKFIPR